MDMRKLVAEDAAAYWSLRLKALQTDPLSFGTAAEEFAQTTVEQAADRISELSGPSFLLGCFDRKELIGVATLSRESGMRERHKAHLLGVYVDASRRGRGVGRTLIGTLLDLARQDPSLDQILLGVGTFNTAAIRTYSALGFEVYGTEPRALKVGSTFVDEHLMILKLR